MGTISYCVLRRSAWRFFISLCATLVITASIAAAGDPSQQAAPSGAVQESTAADVQSFSSAGLPKREAAARPARVELPNHQAGVLAQQFAPFFGGNGVPVAGGLPGFASILKSDAQQFAEMIQETLEPPSWQRVGGPGTISFWPQQQGSPNPAMLAQPFGPFPARPAAGAGVSGLGGGVGDDGQRLVEVIEAIIAPTTWDTVGGPGVIRYWAPRRVLVIRASGGVHEQLSDVIDQLRRAN